MVSNFVFSIYFFYLCFIKIQDVLYSIMVIFQSGGTYIKAEKGEKVTLLLSTLF